MPIINRIAEFADEVAEWRRDFHAHPELQYDVHRTAGKVAELLKSFGVDEVATGIGRTGVVGVIKGRGPGKTIGLQGRHGCAADHRAHRQAACEPQHGEDACLRS